MHTLTRESQEVMLMFIPLSGVEPPDSDELEDAETSIVDADIPIFGQLNITTSSLPNSPGTPLKLKMMFAN